MIVPWLTFVVVGVSIYTGFVKLAACLLRYTVSWKSSFVFAIIMLTLVIVAHVVDMNRPVATRVEHGGGLLLGLITLGRWFFSSRGTDRHGAVLGWGGGVRVTGLAFAIMVIADFTIAISTQALMTTHDAAPR